MQVSNSPPPSSLPPRFRRKRNKPLQPCSSAVRPLSPSTPSSPTSAPVPTSYPNQNISSPNSSILSLTPDLDALRSLPRRTSSPMTLFQSSSPPPSSPPNLHFSNVRIHKSPSISWEISMPLSDPNEDFPSKCAQLETRSPPSGTALGLELGVSDERQNECGREEGPSRRSSSAADWENATVKAEESDEYLRGVGEHSWASHSSYSLEPLSSPQETPAAFAFDSSDDLSSCPSSPLTSLPKSDPCSDHLPALDDSEPEAESESDVIPLAPKPSPMRKRRIIESSPSQSRSPSLSSPPPPAKRSRSKAKSSAEPPLKRWRGRPPKIAAASSSQSVDRPSLARIENRTSDVTLPILPPSVDIVSILVMNLAMHRGTAQCAPQLARKILKEEPSLPDPQNYVGWLALTRAELHKHAFFESSSRSGKDADGNPLEDEWSYVPDKDIDRERAAMLRDFVHTRRRVATAQKTYYYKPISMSRIDMFDEEDV